MSEDSPYDLIVIGAGPGGYVASIRAAQLGLRTACVEQEPALGGTCLRIGCIPSKALLESSEKYEEARERLKTHGILAEGVSLDLKAMMRRKDSVVRALTMGIDSLFRKNKIERLAGRGRLAGPGAVAVANADGEKTYRAKHIILAAGSVSAPLQGVELDDERICTSTEALSWEAVPERLAVIGAGYIGLELGSVWRRLGARVTVLEYFDRILPGLDSEIAAEALKAFKKQGLQFVLGARVASARVEGDSCVVEAEGAEPVIADRVLLAVGRAPACAGLGLDEAGVELDEKGRVRIDEHFATTAPGVYAIGDLVRGPMLAHKAEEEGIACVERIVTGAGHVNYAAIPAVCYTDPEIAVVGRSEDSLKESAAAYRKSVFPFRANGRARALNQTDGFVKILADEATDRILGVHILGPRAGDLIAEAAVAIEFEASAEDLARTCHAHPTLSESLKEAALGIAGRTIHM